LSYIPNNGQIFAAAFAGAIAAFAASSPINDINSSNYINQNNAALAYAEAVDTAWGSNSNNAMDYNAISNASSLALRDRESFLNSAQWNKLAQAVVAVVKGGNLISNQFPSLTGYGSTNPALLVPTWYTDAIFGDDGNSGTSNLSPVKTVMGGIVPKWNTDSPNLPQSTSIFFLNSQTLGQEQIIISPKMGNNANFSFLGQYVPKGTTTIATLVPKNYSTPQILTITLTVPPAGISPGWLIHNITRGSRATVITNTGGTLVMSQPLVANVLGIGAIESEDDTWAITDTVIVETKLDINLRYLNLLLSTSFNSKGLIQALNVLDNSGIGNSTFTIESDGGPIFAIDWGVEAKGFFCALDLTGGDAFCQNVYCPNEISFGQSALLGGFCQTYIAVSKEESLIDNDPVIGNIIGDSATELSIGRAYFGFNATNHPIAAAPLILIASHIFTSSPIWWGTGQLFVSAGGKVGMRDTLNFVDVFKFTGGIDMDGLSTGNTYDPTTGVWTPNVAITPANLDTFKAITNPQTGSGISKAFE